MQFQFKRTQTLKSEDRFFSIKMCSHLVLEGEKHEKRVFGSFKIPIRGRKLSGINIKEMNGQNVPAAPSSVHEPSASHPTDTTS